MPEITFAVTSRDKTQRGEEEKEEEEEQEEEKWEERRVGGRESCVCVELSTGGGDFIGSIGFIREPLS